MTATREAEAFAVGLARDLAARIEDAVRAVRPKVVAMCQGDTSTTVLHPLADIGAILSASRDIPAIKRAFPGSVVRPLGRTRPDPVSVTTGELLPCDIDDEIPF